MTYEEAAKLLSSLAKTAGVMASIADGYMIEVYGNQRQACLMGAQALRKKKARKKKACACDLNMIPCNDSCKCECHVRVR
jgi:hypothetical protein